jgi:recombination protein RecA
MTDMTELLAKLDPKTRKRLLLAQDVHIEKQPTPSVGLNQALEGGLAYGCQVMIWGNKSSGKSSMCMQMLGQAQADGKSVAWIDAERTFDPVWATRLGVDTSSLVISQSTGIANVADDGVDLIKSGIDILVLDSISTVLPTAFFDDSEMKSFEKTGQIGSQAKDLSKLSNMWNGINDNTLIILISQMTTNITPMFTQMQPMGGLRVKHNSATRIKLHSSESEAKAITGEIVTRDKIFTEKVGNKVIWTIEFNKTAPRGATGEYDFYYRGDRVGIDKYGEITDMAIKYGLINQTSKSWFEIDGDKLNGRNAVVSRMRDDTALFSKLEGELVNGFKGSDRGSEETGEEE